MAIQGLRNTGTGGGGSANAFVAGERPLNWREGLLLLEPNGSAPITALTARMKTKKTDDPEFNWWEKPLSAQRVALAANINNSDTTTALNLVSGGLSIPVGAVLYAEETGEIMRVTTVSGDSGASAITVTRGFAGSSKVAITYNGAGVNPNLVVIGTSFEEGSSAPDGMNMDPTKRYNYTQIFRNTLEMTRTARKTRLRTGDQVREAKREAFQYHTLQLEKAWLLGVRSENTLNGKPVRTTGGLLNKLTLEAAGNIKNVASDYGGGLTWSGLLNYLRLIFAFGSNEKMAFTGHLAMMHIQELIRKSTNAQIMISGDKEFGMDVMRLVSPFGTLVLKTHPLLNQLSGGTTGGTPYNGFETWMFVWDFANVTYRPFQDDDTKYEAKYETPGLDGMKSGYLTEAGLEIDHAQTHYILKNLAAHAAG